MGKVLTGQNVCDIFDGVFADNGNIINGVVDFTIKKSTTNNSLSSCVKYMTTNENAQDGICIGFDNIRFNEELADSKVRLIALKLANAVDKNNVLEIKKIKQEYGNTKEFVKARDFLNKKCKDIWNVFDNKNEKINLPFEAFKTLGISNQPSLESLLNDSLRFYERDNGFTTVNIIQSILNNKNMNYTFEDVYSFLKSMYKKEKLSYNLHTVSYLVEKLDANEDALENLGISKDRIKLVIKNLPISKRIRYMLKKFF